MVFFFVFLKSYQLVLSITLLTAGTTRLCNVLFDCSLPCLEIDPDWYSSCVTTMRSICPGTPIHVSLISFTSTFKGVKIAHAVACGLEVDSDNMQLLVMYQLDHDDGCKGEAVKIVTCNCPQLVNAIHSLYLKEYHLKIPDVHKYAVFE